MTLVMNGRVPKEELPEHVAPVVVAVVAVVSLPGFNGRRLHSDLVDRGELGLFEEVGDLDMVFPLLSSECSSYIIYGNLSRSEVSRVRVSIAVSPGPYKGGCCRIVAGGGREGDGERDGQ